MLFIILKSYDTFVIIATTSCCNTSLRRFGLTVIYLGLDAKWMVG